MWSGLAWSGLVWPVLAWLLIGLKLALTRSEQKMGQTTMTDCTKNNPSLGHLTFQLDWAGLGWGLAELSNFVKCKVKLLVNVQK